MDGSDATAADGATTDPFDVFGAPPALVPGSSMTDDVDNNDNTTLPQPILQQRNPANGFNSHHVGTEQAMLQFVRNGIDDFTMKDSIPTLEGEETNKVEPTMLVDVAIDLVDKFCFQRHWMMHIGVRFVLLYIECVQCSGKRWNMSHSINLTERLRDFIQLR